MIKKALPVIVLTIFFCQLQNASGQKLTGTEDYLTERFLNFCKSNPWEEVFVHTDREEYIAGENLWFNIYLLDRQSLNTSSESRIAYFELLNYENRPVVQKRIRIDKGFGPGQILLPDSLSSGKYLIRVYTSWMKNFLPDNCFMKDINIYNAFNVKTFRGRTSRDARSAIPDGAGQNSLTADTGITLLVNNLKPDNLELIVSAGKSFRTVNNNRFYLFIQTHGKINFAKGETAAGEITKIEVSKAELTAGINQITVFDSKFRPLCERYIFTPDQKKPRILMLNSPDSCRPRSKVSLEFDLVDIFTGNSDSANFSISVTPWSPAVRQATLKDYMITGTEFGSEIIREIESRGIENISPAEMDSLLINAKSNWIDWGKILSDKQQDRRYPLENKYHYITGKLLNKDDNEAYPGEVVLMSVPSKTADFQYSLTDYEAFFNFSIPIDGEQKDLVFQPDDPVRNSKIRLESSFYGKYPDTEPTYDSISSKVLSSVSKWSINYQVSKIYESPAVASSINVEEGQAGQRRFYGKPDIERELKDFIKLPTMEEVFFELIPRVVVKNTKSLKEVSIIDLAGNKVYDVPPTLFIDGVIIRDPAVLTNIDPETVERIEVIREIYHVGAYQFYGIVNVITKAGDFSDAALPGFAVRIPYRVVDPVKEFVSYDYSTEEAKSVRTPDFRNTLYWNPSVKPGRNGKTVIEFWTSDIHSDYEISIQGITPGGRAYSVSKILRVR
jgi:hypothetical protein